MKQDRMRWRDGVMWVDVREKTIVTALEAFQPGAQTILHFLLRKTTWRKQSEFPALPGRSCCFTVNTQRWIGSWAYAHTAHPRECVHAKTETETHWTLAHYLLTWLSWSSLLRSVVAVLFQVNSKSSSESFNRTFSISYRSFSDIYDKSTHTVTGQNSITYRQRQSDNVNRCFQTSF